MRCNHCGREDASFYAGNKTKCKACVSRESCDWAKANRARKYATNEAWRKRNRKRLAAANCACVMVWRAVQAGVLVRPTTCEQCGTAGRPEAAHADYSQPLSVLWLCLHCHRTWDAAEPKTLA